MQNLPYDPVPEMVPPRHTVLCPPPLGYTRELDMRDDAPYFNASVYCNRLGLRFSVWLHSPATIDLIRALTNYYREACHSKTQALVMQVKTGSRLLHGYYLHTMLHDALSRWCDFEIQPQDQRRRLPVAPSMSNQLEIPSNRSLTTTLVYTMTQNGGEDTQARIARVISAMRGGSAIN